MSLDRGSILPSNIEDLIKQFAKLPSIGPKTAQRLVFYMLKTDNVDLKQFSNALSELKKGIEYCNTCQNFRQNGKCKICDNKLRDNSKICVVEEPLDVVALEQTSEYNGLYHVLHGTLSPIEGRGPKDIKLYELEQRIKKDDRIIKEVIIATNPSLEGDATSVYIAKLIKPYKIKTTRLAQGIPMGSEIEYADEITVSKALSGRITVN